MRNLLTNIILGVLGFFALITVWIIGAVLSALPFAIVIGCSFDVV